MSEFDLRVKALEMAMDFIGAKGHGSVWDIERTIRAAEMIFEYLNKSNKLPQS